MAQPTSDSWLTGVGFSVSDDKPDYVQTALTTGDAVAAPPTGPGFSLNKDEAEAMLTQAKQVLIEMGTLKTQAEQLRQITPPAADPASTSYNVRLASQGGGQAGAFDFGADHVQIEITYLSELVHRLERALGKTEESDAQASTDVKNAAPSTGGYAG